MTHEMVEAIVVLHIRYLKDDPPQDDDWKEMLEAGAISLHPIRGEGLINVIAQIVIEPTE